MPRKVSELGPVHDPRNLSGILADELIQRRQSGHDVRHLSGPIEAAAARGDDPAPWLDRLASTERRSDWQYREPSDPDAIIGTWSSMPARTRPSRARVHAGIRGGWLGRCVGCMLGKPVEGWTRRQIREYLEPAEAYPPRDFLPCVENPPRHLPPLKPSWTEATRGRVDGCARDDDIDYTILGLHLLESHGPEFGPDAVIDELLDHLPFTRVYTAERVAYRNAADGLRPPATATFRNPYREWIGALIRADVYGYVAAGDPAFAAELAYRDASTSHTGNGVYAAMWAAALIAAAFSAGDAGTLLRASVGWLPSESRLAAAVESIVELHSTGAPWSAAMDRIDASLADYGWVHAIPNVAAIAAALLWCDDDYLSGIGLAVAAGRDTDSTAATVGSILGVLLGVENVPAHLSAPLHDRLRSAIAGFDGAAISELAERTGRLAQQFGESQETSAVLEGATP